MVDGDVSNDIPPASAMSMPSVWTAIAWKAVPPRRASGLDGMPK